MTSLQAKNILNSSLECKEHTLFMTETAKIIVDHMVKTTFDHNSLKTISFGAAHTYIALIREYTPREFGVQYVEMRKSFVEH